MRDGRSQAIELLLACAELLSDEELQENLAGLDEQCGDVMASWKPPWLEEGIQEMNFETEMLASSPVEDWVDAFDSVLRTLWSRAEEADLLPSTPAFIVVLPQEQPLLSRLARLCGGSAVQGTSSALPCVRLIFPKAFDSKGPDNFVKDAKPRRPERVVDLEDKPSGKDEACSDPELRTQDELAVSQGTSHLPSTIKFIHLGILQAATEAQGEAVGLILAVMQLLQEEEIWKRCLALDAYCDGLLSTWQPPWVEEAREYDVSLQSLQQEEEATVHDWAMALDGFCSFVANLALAARIHQAADSGEVHPGTALVVVVPEMSDWHLEVFGPLLRAFKIFMLTEKAWRSDFNGASTVPFSVEAASAMQPGSS